jgi:pSer/pThr/pTyr-binding forkhead associated (FHA) protein
MSMKSWVLHRVQGIGAAVGRADLPARRGTHESEPDLDPNRDTGAEGATLAEPTPLPASLEHLGAYAPLIRAVRDELEHFVASHVRLHVVIADRDRFMLTAVGVRSPGGVGARELLQEFMREFRPEQVKRYLAREVIGRLPNAAVIDLTQFAGLSDLEARERAEEEDEYGELLAALRTGPEAPVRQPYDISVLGRWTENDATVAASREGPAAQTLPTPLAGRRCELDVDDGKGKRRAVLDSIVPGRRYVIGKGSECDVRLDGTYTSRRHAELWFDRGTWYVADGGSTNGIRVESAHPESADAVQPRSAAAGSARAIALGEGMRIVLSARAEGPPGDYPWIALRPAAKAKQAVASTPIAATVAARIVVPLAAPSTPRTAVMSARTAEPVFEITEGQGLDARIHAIRRSELPLTIGRSRGQALVIDWSHAGVSGHHADIDRIDEEAAYGVVHGDNGIDIDGTHYATGNRFHWALGQTMVLGGSLPGEPPCTLSLAQRKEH